MNQNKLLLAILTASGLFFGDLARQSLILAQSDETEPTFEASNSVEEGIKANEGPGEASDTLAEKEVQSEVENKPGGVSYPSLASFKLIQERNIFDPDRRRPREMRRETPVAPPEKNLLPCWGRCPMESGSWLFLREPKETGREPLNWVTKWRATP